ncbi:MAG TPA: radical SAM protein [Vicinamibacterales bacterium]|nr:radical SAM protein [Vicinamibacterales bacterium]
MEISPLLFDLGKPRPTTRQVADTVRAGGAGALTDAIRRADAARYQEVHCRSALNGVKGMPFSWTLNPYRGCTHGCHYCYARRYHRQFELSADDEFASVILVKTNIVEVLRRELRKPSWTHELVALGTATDCYQPIEGSYKLTRGLLEALCEAGNPTSVVTKGPMVVRDTDVLIELSSRAKCSVCVSVPCVDEDVWRALEPGTASPLQRLRAVRELVDAGVHAGVLMAPIVPGISSRPVLLERTIKAAVEHGACFVGANVMHLEGGTRDHFMHWLEKERPELVDGYQQLYATKYASLAYRDEVKKVLTVFRKKYGVEA